MKVHWMWFLLIVVNSAAIIVLGLSVMELKGGI